MRLQTTHCQISTEVRLTKKLKKPEHDGRANGTRPIAFKKRKANGKAVALPPEELSDMDVDEDAWPPKPSMNRRKQRSLLKKTEHDHRANGTRPVALKNRKAKGKAVASGTEELSDTDVDDDARRPERSNDRRKQPFPTLCTWQYILRTALQNVSTLYRCRRGLRTCVRPHGGSSGCCLVPTMRRALGTHYVL